MNTTDLTVLEAPFEFPEDLQLSLLLRRLIMGQKAWITGSYPLSLLYPFEPNDIDVFCHDDAASGILRLLDISAYERDDTDFSPGQSKSTNGQLSLNFKHESYSPINIIIGKFECVQDVWATFDLSCCEIGIVWDEEEKILCLVGSDKFQQFQETGVVAIMIPIRELKTTLRRVWKYADRGFIQQSVDSCIYEITPDPHGFVGKRTSGPNWVEIFDNLPPLTPKD